MRTTWAACGVFVSCWVALSALNVAFASAASPERSEKVSAPVWTTAGHTIEGLHLEVDLLHERYEACGPAWILVRIVNSGERTCHVPFERPEKDYTFAVIDANTMEPVPLTRFGQALRAEPARQDYPSLQTLELKSGGSLQDAAPINRLFDLTLPGRYLLSVERTLRGPISGNWITLSVGRIPIEVTPPALLTPPEPADPQEPATSDTDTE